MTIASTIDQAVILADRVALRPLQPSDAGHLGLYAGDERVARATPSIPHPLPPGWAEALIARAAMPGADVSIWALEGRGDDTSEPGGTGLLGLMSLTKLERNQSEVLYWVAPAFWNTGLASEALAALIAANPHGSAQLYAQVFQDNPGSARVLTNCGFDYLGDAESFSVSRDSVVQTWTYALKLKS
ncbi:MAG: GNAT family N-acetyltransferase [Rhodobacteraceae bacterium]|nr:GNAT family N-acetyltransferase [Paracoccaceae bacterium]